MTDRCVRCEREMVPCRDWSAMSRPARRAASAAGRRRTGAAGFCSACYEFLRRTGQLASTVRANALIDPSRRCVRCGMSGVVAGRTLCRDCLDVTTDLRESGRWADPVPA